MVLEEFNALQMNSLQHMIQRCMRFVQYTVQQVQINIVYSKHSKGRNEQKPHLIYQPPAFEVFLSANAGFENVSKYMFKLTCSHTVTLETGAAH